MKYTEVIGDIFNHLTEFEIITHGCNCFCTMGAGIAPLMANYFGCDEFELEDEKYRGNINKLGQIDCEELHLSSLTNKWMTKDIISNNDTIKHSLIVINSYSQYKIGYKAIDYEALTLCLRKINHYFKGKHIGLPRIGAGLAGGDWNRIKSIIQNELYNMDVTVYIHPKDINNGYVND